MISFRPRARFDKSAAILLIEDGQWKARKFYFRNPKIQEIIKGVAGAGQFSAENGEIFPLVLNKKLLLLVGVGKKDKMSLTALRTTVRRTFLSSYLKKIKDVEVVPHDEAESVVKAVIEGYAIGTYTWRKYFSPPKDDQTVTNKNVTVAVARKYAYAETIKICEGVTLTRDLVNDNADVVHSRYLESVIRGLVKGKKNTKVEILNRREMKAKGLNLHLAVNQGSNKEPKLIIVKYHGAAYSGNYTAVIGKGVTFDTGGINLKPSGHIEAMRYDMSGAAAVIGALKTTLDLKLKKNVIFAVGIAENAIDANAYKPGDVFKSYSGKTVEIGNTDAEGRLVLADAISYVVKNYKPSRLIDLATLTGACVVALGFDYSGLVTNSDEFCRAMIHSSNETDDRAWRLPSYPELKEYVKSTIADIKNTSTIKGGGTITAAEFLRQFTNDTPWGHLDIAGVAFVEGKERMYFGHGGTGYGVRLLTHFLQHN